MQIVDNNETYTRVPNIVLRKNGKVIKDLTAKIGNTQTINDLEKGTYLLGYRSLFGTKEQLKLVISEPKKYTVSVCLNEMDYKNAKHKPIIDLFKRHRFL